MTIEESTGIAVPTAATASVEPVMLPDEPVTAVDPAVAVAEADATALAGARTLAEAADIVETAASVAVTYPIAPGYRVNVRSGPSTSSQVVRVLPYGVEVSIRCQRHGQKVTGPYGSSDIWDCIAPGEYISDTYVRTGSDGLVAPICS